MPATDRMSRAGSKDAGQLAETLDLRGLRCPLPVLKTAKRLASMQPGERVTILCDDPLAGLDLPAFCAQEGQGLVEAVAQDGSSARRFVVERGADAPALGRN